MEVWYFLRKGRQSETCGNFFSLLQNIRVVITSALLKVVQLLKKSLKN